MQTWLWSADYTFEKCYIERQHASSDKFFEHLEPENVDLGPDYVSKGELNYDLCGTQGLYVGLLVSRSPDGILCKGGGNNNIFSGLFMYGGTFANARSLIEQYNQAAVAVPTTASPEDIVAVFMYPARFGAAVLDVYPSKWESQNEWHVVSETDPDFLINIDGYVPKNRKLFNAPYQYMELYNGDGSTKSYHWEQWAVGSTLTTSRRGTIDIIGKFQLVGTAYPPVCAICYPIGYLGLYDSGYDCGLTIENFPQCAWSNDIFKAWWAQNKASTAVNLIGSGIDTAIGIGSGAAGFQNTSPNYASWEWEDKRYRGTANMVGSSGGFIRNYAGTVAQMADLKKASPQTKGTLTSESLRAVMNRYDFYVRYQNIRKEYAEKIDNYFTLYGYAKNAIDYPSLTARERWTYVKTRGCEIMGNIPSDDKTMICKIYDKGIRFWRDGSEIGQYSLSNLPISEVTP
jgi:hypothetical protein